MQRLGDEAEATLPVTVRQQAEATRDRVPVQVQAEKQVLKAVRCLFTEDFLREVLLAYNTKEIVGINVAALNIFDNDAVVDVQALIEAGIVKNPRDGVKILGVGTLEKKLTVKTNQFSKSAVEKIEAAGGKAEVI